MTTEKLLQIAVLVLTIAFVALNLTGDRLPQLSAAIDTGNDGIFRRK